MKKKIFLGLLLLLLIIISSFAFKDTIYNGESGQMTKGAKKSEYPYTVKFTISEKPNKIIREEYNGGDRILIIPYSYSIGSKEDEAIYKLIDEDGNDAELTIDEKEERLKLAVDADHSGYQKQIEWKIVN